MDGFYRLTQNVFATTYTAHSIRFEIGYLAIEECDVAFPSEFKYTNEADFVAKLMIPLLRRLGYGVVVRYHGSSEFGKDLVFGRIDPFGHVVYHALQAKYVPSLGQSEAHGLVEDAIEAFANPFRNPNTGSSERISTFFAVNGGSISGQAKEHYFNKLLPTYGANVRLLDGAEIVALDRMGVVAGANTRATALGLVQACEMNVTLALTRIVTRIREFNTDADLAMLVTPSVRFNTFAFELYLSCPVLPHTIDEIKTIANTAEIMARVNKWLDAHVGIGATNKGELRTAILTASNQIVSALGQIAERARQMMAAFDPIVAM